MNKPADQTVDLQASMDSTAALLGLPLHPDHRPGVLHYLKLVVSLAPLVTDFAGTLSVADESGNSFVPVAPADGAQP